MRAMWIMLTLAVGVAILALFGAMYHDLIGGWIVPARLSGEDLNVISRSVSAGAAVLTLIVVVVTATAAWIQLHHVRRSSELATTLEVLKRYIEDEKLFAARNFVHTRMGVVNREISSISNAAKSEEKTKQRESLEQARSAIEAAVKAVSSERFELLDLLRVVNTLNHTAFLIKEKSIPEEIAQDIEKLTEAIYWKLLPLIEYEQARRGEELAKPVYAKHLVERYGRRSPEDSERGRIVAREDENASWS